MVRMSLARRLLLGALGLLLLGALGGPGGGVRAASLTTQDLDTVSAATLATTIAGTGVSISNVAYTGAAMSAGLFAGGQGVIGFERGLVLSTGRIADVAGPNRRADTTTFTFQPGDSDLDLLTGGGADTFDAAVLAFDFVPASGQVSFRYVFASEEYNEFVGSEYNDVFAFYVNGVNCATVNGQPVSVNTINRGPSGADPGVNGAFYLDNPSDGFAGPRDTELDGLTTVLTCQTAVNPGVVNHLKLAIADVGDSRYDAAVFIEAGSLAAAGTGCLSPNALNLGSQAVGGDAPAQFATFTNCGSGPLAVASLGLSGPNPIDFTFTSGCIGVPLAPGASCALRVTFHPIAAGPRAATLRIAFAGGAADLALTGTGVVPSPPFRLTVQAVGDCTVAVAPDPGPYPAATQVTLTPRPAAGWTFVSWASERGFAGWADPWTFAMNADHTVTARCVRTPAFPDYAPGGPAAADPVLRMAALAILRGYQDGRFGGDDRTLRAQMAALIARGMGFDRAATWAQEDHAAPFPDRGAIDDDLWRSVGTLYFYNVARGYPDGTYDPFGAVLYAQTVSFITRAMVTNGYWQQQPDDPGLYPNVPASSGHRADIATYVHYAGLLPGTGAPGQDWPLWDRPATRLWFAQTEWRALDSFFARGFAP